MSRSLNKVMLIGNLGKDPEIKTVGSGGRVAEFSLATTRTWNGTGGDRQEKTEWHRCVAWNAKGQNGGGLADIIERYVKKGDRLYIEGSIEYRQWQDKDGQTKYMTEIKVRDLVMLGGKGGGAEGGEGGGAARPRSSSPERARSGAGNAPANSGAGDDFEDFPNALESDDDDLPF